MSDPIEAMARLIDPEAWALQDAAEAFDRVSGERPFRSIREQRDALLAPSLIRARAAWKLALGTLKEPSDEMLQAAFAAYGSFADLGSLRWSYQAALEVAEKAVLKERG